MIKFSLTVIFSNMKFGVSLLIIVKILQKNSKKNDWFI